MNRTSAYVVMDSVGEIDHADTLKDARHKRNVCLYGGPWTPGAIWIVRMKDGCRF